ncbi:glyoxalase [Xanthomonas arboricola]|uniref:VOC family protein n=1 Tax=Xanthomonas arboricola TaxID=56448 RepID=UPI0007ED15E6|nr:VOC family protein [Xanthomonas arboricola]OBR72083.1 glyoxalase [Xanthomonas arboricola]
MSQTPASTAPALQGVLETGVYVADLERACAFYARVLGLAAMYRDTRMAAYAIAPGQVLLLFLQGSTASTVTLPGGTIPPHDGSGRAHYAFAIASDALGGGHSLYFRDPDAHLLELATPGLWPNY